MPWQELITRTLGATLVVTVVFYLYTSALLSIGQQFGGALKTFLVILTYLLMTAVLGGALLLVLTSAGSSEHRNSWQYILTVMSCWIVVALPGFLHLRSRLEALQRYGFFRPASSPPRR